MPPRVVDSRWLLGPGQTRPLGSGAGHERCRLFRRDRRLMQAAVADLRMPTNGVELIGRLRSNPATATSPSSGLLPES